ncbi:MAG: TonB-dependent receptor [Pseudomonadota bacterium]
MKNFFKVSNINSYLAPAVCASLVSVVLLQPSPVSAQEGSAGALLDEIVTTARKKSEAEAVQDVPAAITAFGTTQLEALFVQKLSDISYLMPNVQMEEIGTFPGVQNFSIRGQGINSSIPSVDPTVGVFVDGVYLGSSFGVVLDTFDIERIEVLRGPQGLLFGRNVTGGAVVIQNARPTGEFGFRARAGLNDGDQYNLAAAIEGSLVDDRLAAKLVVMYDDDSGYFENPTLGRDFGEFETTLIRPTLVWTPTDESEITLIWENGSTEGDGAAWTNITAQRAGAQEDFTTTLNDAGFTDIEWNQVTIEANFDAWGGTLTNIVGYRRVESDSFVDIDGTQTPIFAAAGPTEQDQISNETRWSGRLRENWEATIGLYVFDQEINYREGRSIQGGALLRALGGDMDGSNIGVFWNNDFYLGDEWVISAGVRYTDEEKTARIISAPGGVGCSDIVNFNCTFQNLEGDWDNVTPKLGVQWNFAEGSQLYGFFSQGYRSGGFNFRNARPDVIPPGPTREEQNNTFEVGLKTTFNDGRMRFNIAAFHNEIEDTQRELNVGDPSPAGVVVLQATFNAGDVTIQGVEADFVALLTDTFSINLAAGWQDSDYDRIDPVVAQIEAGLGLPFPLIGGDLPRLAPSNYSAGFSWDIPAGNLGVFNFAGNYSFRERNAYDDSNLAFFDDQERINLSANWFSPGEQLQLAVYGKNLGDEANWGNLTSIAGLFTAGPMQKGRIVGFELNWRYE